MEVIGQLHSLATVCPRKDPLTHTAQEAGWPPVAGYSPALHNIHLCHQGGEC
jgi:hypothetical protein